MFGERIADLLLGMGEITPAQVEEARRTQSFFGGGLETHLVKLGYIDEAILGRALSEVTHAPYASGTQLMMVPLEARSALAEELVRKYRVCPFKLEKKSLSIAMLNPKDAIAVAALKSATGMEIDVWVTSEFRIEKALHRHYGITPRGKRGLSVESIRKARNAGAPSSDPDSDDGVRTLDSEPELGLDGLPLDAEITFDDHLFHRTGDEDPSDSILEEPEEEAAPVAEPVTGVLDPMGQLEARLATSMGRTAIADALLDYCSGTASRCALFALAGEGIRCIAARGRGMESDQIFQAVIPRDDGSIFDTALKGGEFYLGPVAPLPSNKDLYSLLGGKIPPLILLMPIRVRNRTVALLYLDDDDRALRPPDLTVLKRVSAKAGLALQILILRSKLLDL